MLQNRELRIAAGLTLLAVVVASVPYLLAASLVSEGSEFSGFLMNPIDGFSYLAKMAQGPRFEFTLPYAPEPGPGALLFVYHLALGAISSVLTLPLLVTYHTARVVGGIALYAACYLFFAKMLRSGRAKWAAFVLTLFGSGLGWLGLALGLFAIDLWVPEAVPFLSAYANAHFPLAVAALVFGVTLIVSVDVLERFRLPLIFSSGLVLALTQPLAVPAIGLILGIWIAWEFVLQRSVAEAKKRDLWPWVGGSIALILGAGPLLLYDWIAVMRHPVLQLWNSQNITPTPSLPEVLLGYGLILALAIVGIVRTQSWASSEGRLLTVWSLLGLALLFVPLPLQRRMTLGLFIPLAALAGVGLDALTKRRGRFVLLLGATLIFSIPSNLVVVGSGMAAADQGQSGVTLNSADRALQVWAGQNLPAGSLILAGPNSGNQIPAQGPLRVLYGHPFETPRPESQLALIEELWRGGLESLQDAGIGYVFYGSEERALGAPSWLRLVELIHRIDTAELYKVPEN